MAAAMQGPASLMANPFYRDLYESVPKLITDRIADIIRAERVHPHELFRVIQHPRSNDDATVWQVTRNMSVIRCPHLWPGADNSPDHQACYSPHNRAQEFMWWYLMNRSSLPSLADENQHDHVRNCLERYYSIFQDETPTTEAAKEQHIHAFCRLVGELKDQSLSRNANISAPWRYIEQIHGILDWTGFLWHNCIVTMMDAMIDIKHRRVHPWEANPDDMTCMFEDDFDEDDFGDDDNDEDDELDEDTRDAMTQTLRAALPPGYLLVGDVNNDTRNGVQNGVPNGTSPLVNGTTNGIGNHGVNGATHAERNGNMPNGVGTTFNGAARGSANAFMLNNNGQGGRNGLLTNSPAAGSRTGQLPNGVGHVNGVTTLVNGGSHGNGIQMLLAAARHVDGDGSLPDGRDLFQGGPVQHPGNAFTNGAHQVNGINGTHDDTESESE